MSELERCPRCGKTHGAMEYGDSSGMKFIVCAHGCLKEGPKRRTSTGAITAWNALPRALVWTTEPPKVSGLYWHKTINHPKEAGIISYSQHHLEVLKNTGTEQWAGPIPEPQEPTL